MKFRSIYAISIVLVFSLFLASCKVPATFSESFGVASSTDDSEDSDDSDESTDGADGESDSSDKDVVEEVCGHLDSDTHNAALKDVMNDPFMHISFASGVDLLMPRGPCVRQDVLQDTEHVRKVQFTYSCREVKGIVVWTTSREEEVGSTESIVEADVEVFGKNGNVREVQSVLTHARFLDGASQVDREFQETYFKDGVSHTIAGVYFYDFIPDEESELTGEGFVQISGNVSHTKGDVIENVYSLTSEGLHRAACGFDDGRIVLRTSERVKTVTYAGCGRPRVADSKVESVE